MRNSNQIFSRFTFFKLFSNWLIIGFVGFSFITPSFAQAPTNPSGLELPRFVSTRSKPINVRVGPSTKYEIAWVYVKSGIPVEVVKEFDTWRKIRDLSGEEGWVHQSLLNGHRTGRIKASNGAKIALYAKPSEQSDIRAQLGLSYPIDIKQCDGKWCGIEVDFTTKKNKKTSISGYVLQSNIFGVYQNEKFKK